MKTLEQRLFHLFPAAVVAQARTITPASVACPRVGQVRATVMAEDGDEHEVSLELSAHRRGGMTLETRCSTPAGRAGRPCAVLAAGVEHRVSSVIPPRRWAESSSDTSCSSPSSAITVART
ncbi:MAG: hypothetical protein ACKON8_12365, partial [Planctomycetota bacterium]